MNRLIILLFLLVSTLSSSASLPTPILSFPSNNSNRISPSLGLGCSSVSGASGYEFRFSNNNSFISPISMVGSNNQVWIFDLFFSTQYFWQARAFNATDTSNWSSVFNFRTVADVSLFSPLNGSSNENVDVQLAWDQIDGINGYEIELDTVETFNSPLLTSIFEGGNTSTNTIDLLFSTVYFWRVRAISNVDTSNWSSDFVFLTVGQPSLLFPLNASQLIGPNPSLSWFGLSGINGYELQLDTTFDYSSTAMQSIILGLNPSQQLNDLYFGKYYNWRVRAFHNADTSDWSGSFNFFVFDKPTTITPNPNDTINNTQADLSWIGTVGVNGYEVQIDTISDFSSPLLETKFESNTNAQIQDLNFGLTYYWRVRTYHSIDSSAWSFIRTFTVVEKPNLILPFDGTTNTETTLSFYWNNIQNTNKFEFLLDTVVDFSSTALIQSELIDTSTSIQNLYYNQIYYWKVRAINGIDTSSYSLTSVFNTYAAPTLITPVNFATSISINPTVSWLDYTGNVTDEIQLSTDSNFTVSINAQIIGGITSFSALNYNTSYWWRVRSINSIDTTEWSGAFKFTTELELNIAPVLISPADLSNNILCPDTSLIWNAIIGQIITGYEIEIDSSINFTNANIYSISDTILQLNSLVPYTNYFWCVRGINGSGPGIWSSIWTFETSGTTGLIALQSNENIIVSSNPFDHELKITSASTSKKKIEIYNELGELFYSDNFISSLTINTSNFASGLYFVKCSDQANQIIAIKKLIKK